MIASNANQERCRTLFESIPDGIIIMDHGFNYIDVNPALCKMLDYTREELIGSHISKVITQDEIRVSDPIYSRRY